MGIERSSPSLLPTHPMLAPLVVPEAFVRHVPSSANASRPVDILTVCVCRYRYIHSGVSMRGVMDLSFEASH